MKEDPPMCRERAGYTMAVTRREVALTLHLTEPNCELLGVPRLVPEFDREGDGTWIR